MPLFLVKILQERYWPILTKIKIESGIGSVLPTVVIALGFQIQDGLEIERRFIPNVDSTIPYTYSSCTCSPAGEPTLRENREE